MPYTNSLAGRARRVAAVVALVFGAPVAFVQPGATASAPLAFGEPVRVSPELGAAWEPTMLIDRFGNVFVTARKDTGTQLLVAPDDRSATATRSMSWLWYSSDGGRTFANMPAGLPAEAGRHVWGYEGDIALDDADHLYFVDQTYADSTFTRWSVRGLGSFEVDMHRPAVPTGQPVDDRPWLAARGDGLVLYVAQAGNPELNPAGDRGGGEAHGPGRFAAYVSRDGGNTFELRGRSLHESGGCRPAADKRPGSGVFVVVCTNDGGSQESLLAEPHGRGTLWAYVSADDGATFERFRVGDYNADADTFDWPVVTIGPDGTIWVMHADADKVEHFDDGSFQILTNRLNLYRSSDGGRTWSKTDITPVQGRYRWGWITTSSQGKIGIAVHHRPGGDAAWGVHAAVFRPGEPVTLTKVDEVDAASRPEPPSEMIGLAFAPDERLAIAWTRIEAVAGQRFRRVYFAMSEGPRPVHARPPRVAGARREPLPATGFGSVAAGGICMLAASGALAVWTRRGRRPTP